MNRRRFVVLTPVLFVSACGDLNTFTSPSTSTQQPVQTPKPNPLQLDWGTLTFHGYANGSGNLLEVIRQAGLNPQMKSTGSKPTDLVVTLSNHTPSLGWFFYHQNRFFASRIQDVEVWPGELWAAYQWNGRQPQ